MSVFLTVATVCTMSICNGYAIDMAPNRQDAEINTHRASNNFLQIWGDEKDLNAWLSKYKIGETVFEIVSVDFDVQEVKDVDIP